MYKETRLSLPIPEGYRGKYIKRQDPLPLLMPAGYTGKYIKRQDPLF
jgi:hypothetical protein